MEQKRIRPSRLLARAGALSLGLLMALASPALAAGDSTAYTLTIPATLTVANAGWNATDGICVKGTLATGRKLTVTASSGDDGFALVNASDASQKISYALASAEGDIEATTSWEFDTLGETATVRPLGIIAED